MTFIVKCVPVLKDWHFCCCSCNLRAAAIVLAWFAVVTEISEIVTCITYLSHPALDRYTSYETKGFFISVLGTATGSTILNALLLYGIHNKKPLYMLPFLVLDLIGLVIFVVVMLILVVIATVNNWIVGLLTLVISVAVLVLAAFCWIVLYSYYRQIEEEKNRNAGIVNYTYGIPNDQEQILAEDKNLGLYPNKMVPDVA